ncbi:MAG: holo-ACP synthase [Chitinophagaceae bacterium]|nr:holo-ACP synthase [Chitinophagaceae bacterium]
MIIGVGTDLIEVERVAGKISKDEGFRELVFTVREIAYCEAKANKFQHYAARFAAKEAFLKAIGTGWISGIAFNEIEITNDQEGKPSLKLIGATLKFLETRGICRIWVSLSHLSTISSAVVIIEKE